MIQDKIQRPGNIIHHWHLAEETSLRGRDACRANITLWCEMWDVRDIIRREILPFIILSTDKKSIELQESPLTVYCGIVTLGIEGQYIQTLSPSIQQSFSLKSRLKKSIPSIISGADVLIDLPSPDTILAVIESVNWFLKSAISWCNSSEFTRLAPSLLWF